ncbi:MAG: hypothetical protein LBJ59_12775 [Zoogloeaceae bacterium]|jgi:CDP-diglyceride synthetase|nr:hypothetical protein [Zoogloeaceae bacterium]
MPKIAAALAFPLIFFAALLLLPQMYWTRCMAVLLTVAAWEWAYLTGIKSSGRLVFAALFLALCVGALFFLPAEVLRLPETQDDHLGMVFIFSESQYLADWVYALVAVFWCLIAPLWAWHGGRLTQTAWGKGFQLVLGAGLLLAVWPASVQLRDEGYGVLLLVYLLCFVRVIEVFALFCGQRFAGRARKCWRCCAIAGGAVIGCILFSLILSGMLMVIFYARGFPPSAREVMIIGSALLSLSQLPFIALSIGGGHWLVMLRQQAGVETHSLPIRVLEYLHGLMAVLPTFALALLWLMRSDAP